MFGWSGVIESSYMKGLEAAVHEEQKEHEDRLNLSLTLRIVTILTMCHASFAPAKCENKYIRSSSASLLMLPR